MNAAVLTVSDGVHHGTRKDQRRDARRALACRRIRGRAPIVPDKQDEIAAAIADLADRSSVV